ncbi:MAG: YfhO family protein, partial [Coprococcus sp.]
MKKENTKFYIRYTILFAIVSMFVFSFFIVYKKSFVWNNDGLYQHYNAFVYFGAWVREIIKGIINNHKIVVPMWEFGIGYGADIITTLGYYVFGDPFALISVVTPAAYAEIGYAVSIILRIYVAGAAFLVYAKKMNCRNTYAIYGAIMYAFCAYTIVASIRHPFFICPMIWFPLILAGAEDILAGRKPFGYIISIFLAAVSNFYFFYILVLLTIAYVCIRVFSEKENRMFKRIIVLVLKYAGFALIGVMLASFLFLPNALNFLENKRVSDAYIFNPFYYIGQYETLFGTFVGTESMSNWMYIGMVPLAYVGTAAMLFNKKKESWLKWQLGLFLLFMILPVAGHIMNGFGYVCNRWSFAWSFFVAFAFVKGFPYLLEAEKRKKYAVCIFCVIYSLVCMMLFKSRTKETMSACVILLVCILFVLCSDGFGDINIKGHSISKNRLQKAFVCALTVMCVFEMAYYRYSFTEKNYLKEFIDAGKVYDSLAKDRMEAWKLKKDKSFYRIDDVKINNKQKNYYINSGQSNTTLYWSLVNPYITEFMQYNNAYSEVADYFQGLDSRSMLIPLASCKYLVAGQSEGEKEAVPYTFSYVASAEGENGTYDLYKTEYSLPIGYAYDSIISEDEYAKMTVAKRQQVMLQSAVIASENLENMGDLSKLNSKNPEYSDELLAYEITGDGNVEIKDNTIEVKENNASVTLSFTCPADSELYVEFNGFSFKSCSAKDFMSEEEYNKMSAYDRKTAEWNQKYWTPATQTVISAFCNNTTNNFTHYNAENAYAEGRDSYLLNLYYDDEARNSVKLKFSQKGIYTFEELNVICQPMDDFKDWINLLKEDTMTSVNVSPDNIKGTVDLEKSKLLCLSVPYSKGWKCYVDGEEKELLRVNVMYLGVVLDPGKHQIELKYEAPFVKTGLCVTMAGIVILVLLAVV